MRHRVTQAVPKALETPPQTIEDCYRIIDVLIVAMKDQTITPEAADQLSDISMLMAEFFRLREVIGADMLDKILTTEEFGYSSIEELNEKYEKLCTIHRNRS